MADMSSTELVSEEREELPLEKAAEYLLVECRTIVPGIQALFGFQLVSVFSQRFSEQLSHAEQELHLIAIILVVVAMALIMTPAAYHRETGGREITETFLKVSTKLVVASMIPLALALCMDFYLVARVILNSFLVPIVSGILFIVCMTLWFVLPRWKGFQRLLGR
jgi:hypothetical protein